jgi:hypothetical protein
MKAADRYQRLNRRTRKMFSKLWKAPTVPVALEDFEFEIPRPFRDPLRFNGLLEFESNGSELESYKPGDPFHILRLYKRQSGGYAAIVEFHVNADKVVIEAAIVKFESDVDDYFCLHAGDQFYRMALTREANAGSDKELERRVLACYDHQLMHVMKHLEIGTNERTEG